MSSMLSQCAGCGTTIAIGHPCATCPPRPSVEGAGISDSVLEYQCRKQIHDTNFKLGMLLRMGTGLLGLLTAISWFFVCYLGSITAFLMIGVLTVFTAILGWITLGADKYFPVALLCPGCQERLDQLTHRFDQCPSCNCQLKQ